MPIRPERAALYPDNWTELSQQVREEAGQRCEWCGAPNALDIVRKDGTGTYSVWCEETDTDLWFNARGRRVKQPSGWYSLGYDEDLPEGFSVVRVVLTVAHLDQDARNNARENLAALCQRCHLTYDNQPLQRMKRAELEHGQRNIMDWFDEVTR